MRIAIDNITRFFTVVGAPYPPDRNTDRETERRVVRHSADEAATLTQTDTWLQNDR